MEKPTALRRCEQCGGDLPAGRASRRFCSRRCVNKAAWANCDKAARAEQTRAWRERTREARLALTAERLARVVCIECKEPILSAVRSTRKFCSRRCINAASLRDRAFARKEATQRRRAAKAANGAFLVTEADWLKLCRRFYGKCAYCGIAGGAMTKDHVVPISRGGHHSIGNLLPACFPCNASKRDDLLVYWLNGRAKARLSA